MEMPKQELQSSELFLVGNSGRLYKRSVKDIVVGITSRVSKKKHMILIDYDNIKLKILKAYLKFLINKFKLPNAYIIRTSKGRKAVVFFKKILFDDYIDILTKTNCCVNFRYYTIRSKLGTLRISKKWNKKSSVVKVLGIVKSPYKEDAILRDEFMKVLQYESKSIY